MLLDLAGIERGYMTTIHAYTGDQPTQDTLHHDLYRARAAALSMIPTSTGAAKAIGLVLPELAGKLDGAAIRVPTANVSVVDLSFVPGRDVTRDEINAAFAEAAGSGPLLGILAATTDPLVSVDLNHTSVSCTVALPRPRWWTASWRGSWPGTTTNGAFRPGWRTWLWPWPGCDGQAAAMTFRTLDQAQLAAKRALVRVDFNVPVKDGRSPTMPACDAPCRQSTRFAAPAPRRSSSPTSAGPRAREWLR